MLCGLCGFYPGAEIVSSSVRRLRMAGVRYVDVHYPGNSYRAGGIAD